MSKGRYSQAGGFILAASIIAGTVAGVIVHQSSVGFLAGSGVGILLAIVIWYADSRR